MNVLLSYGIVLPLAAAIVVLFTLIIKSKKYNLYFKILGLVLFSLFFFRYMSGEEAIASVISNSNVLFSSSIFNALSIISMSFSLASVVLLALYGFFSKISFLNLIAKYLVSISVLLQLAILPQYIIAITGSSAFGFRAVLICLELAVMMAYLALLFIQNKSIKVAKRNIFSLILLLLLAFVVAFPSYGLQVVFGAGNIGTEIVDLGLWHRVYLYGSIVIPIALYYLFKEKDYSTKKLLLLYISIGCLINFLYKYKFIDWLTVTNWPLHLCHTAMYLVVICLIFKLEKVFYFTYFINVLGAFLAMAMPNSTETMFAANTLYFWSNHYIAFFMPILMVALGIYRKPKMKEYYYSLIGFTGYFVLVLILNAWFTNYGTVDYFFINSNFIADKLGVWAEDLRLNTLQFNIGNLNFVIYPIYQFLYWLVYTIAAAAMWFVYEQVCTFFQGLNDITTRRKAYKLEMLALQINLEGRSIEQPMNTQNKDKLVLNNFSKIYAASSVYAVKDACLEVQAGKIFGFLGPNGAGKSTIIKSIVGIQPITSGSIEVCGYDVKTQSVQAKSQIGFVPDHYALYEKLTGREYINYIADLYKVNKDERDKRIENYVNIFELNHSFDNQMKTYSHGMKQKIAIMAALVHNPKLWILDEPLTGLDPNSIFQVKKCMKEHAEAGNIVFFSSHIIDVVERLCDEIAIIKKGQIQVKTSLKELGKKKTTLESFYMNIIENTEVDAVKVEKQKKEKQPQETLATKKTKK